MSRLRIALAASMLAPTRADDDDIQVPNVTVFEDGVGYDSAKLLASVRGRVGRQ